VEGICAVSKYDPLWAFVQASDARSLQLSFGEIRSIIGFDIDHSFLNFKKELLDYGYRVGPISLKNKTVDFVRSR
jgi:hypothetical protein